MALEKPHLRRVATSEALARLYQALTTWPDTRTWAETFAFICGYAAVAVALGSWSGLLEPHLTDAPLLPLLLRTLILPSLAEELVFRVLPPPRFALPALVLYVLYHPLNAWLFIPAARPVFYDPVFLMLAALLGACCTVLYRRTRSLWPPLLLHWLAVFSGVAFFGLMPDNWLE